MGKIKRILPILLAVLLVIPLAACESDGNQNELQFFAMNTYMVIRADGAHAETALTKAEETIRAVERELEVRVLTPTGTVSRLNAANGAAVSASPELIGLLETAIAANVETGGAFDITLYPFSKLWDFTGVGHIPSAEELADAMQLTGSEKVVVNTSAGTVQLTGGAQIDLGAIAKGYAADLVAADMRSAGIESALLNLGGNVLVIGSRADGEAWRVAVADPKNTENVVGVLAVTDKAVVTSGTYERFFMDGAMRYHHLLDPQTGKPARTGLESVTIVCDSAERADILSTALFVMGEEKALEFWKQDSGFEMILIREDKTIVVTAPLRAQFEETVGTGYKIEVAD